MKKLITVISFFILSLSCTSMNPDVAFFERDYKDDFNDVVEDFCIYISHKPVILVDIVHYQTLKPDEKSLFLTEYLRNSLVENCNANVYQIEFTKNIILRQSGNTILKRDIEKLKQNKYKSKYVITGTYEKTQNYVILFIRLISVSGKIKKSVIRKIKYYNPNVLREDPFS